jgi:PRC-barrel domain
MRRATLTVLLLLSTLTPGWAESAKDNPAPRAPAASTPAPSPAPAPAPAAAPAPAPPVPATIPAKPPPLPPNLETLAAADARDILGKKVSGAAGEDMGLVVDVLFDEQKQPRAVVIDFGGFLGVGTRKIAVDWKLLQFAPADAKAPLKVALIRADIQAAPEYKEGDKTISVVAGRLPPAPAPAPPPAGH